MQPQRPLRSATLGKQRIGGSKIQRQADADQERRVDQADQQEHALLQHGCEFRLARRGFEEFRAHDADADTGAGGAQADHQSDTHRRVGLNESDCVHSLSGLLVKFEQSALVVLFRHRDVDDRQHHEDVGLQQHNQDVEDRPSGAECDLCQEREPAPDGPSAHRESQQGDQNEQQLAGIHVAVQPHAERYWFGKQLNEIEDDVEGQQPDAERGGGPFVQVAADALGANRKDDDHRQYDDGLGNGAVEIGGRQYAPELGAEYAGEMTG